MTSRASITSRTSAASSVDDTAVEASLGDSGALAAPGAAAADAAHDLRRVRRMSRRRRAVLWAALAGLAAVLALAARLAAEPDLEARWQASASGRDALAASRQPALARMNGEELVRLEAADKAVDVEARLLDRSPRWLSSDADRDAQRRMLMAIAAVRAEPTVTLRFADGDAVAVRPSPRGWRGLGGMFWLMALLALLPCTAGVAILAIRRDPGNRLFCIAATAQAGCLLIAAVESVPGIGPPSLLGGLYAVPVMALDAVTAAALLHLSATVPTRLPSARAVAAAGWAACAGFVVAASFGGFAGLWWVAQAVLLAVGAASLAAIARSQQRRPHPLGRVFGHFGRLTWLSTAGVTAIVAACSGNGGETAQVLATQAPVIWRVLLIAGLTAMPLLAGTQHLMREFAVLAGVSAAAAVIQAIFLGVFAVVPFAALSLTLFVALAAHLCIRQWMLRRLAQLRAQAVERMFGRLHLVSRALQTNGERSDLLLATLLKDVFEPAESMPSRLVLRHAHVVDAGAGLVVPLPPSTVGDGMSGIDRHASGAPLGDRSPTAALELRFAGRGACLFTRDDARLADRFVEQLERALRFDRAVEQGRSEERVRLAQDLHDDIGARLLTMMFQAPNREMESYLRHTLQDLKTLTHGLAATGHRLADAAAEWKADLAQRCEAVPLDLRWSFEADADPLLGIVQWSSLTRVLRELSTNAFAHARARRIEIDIRLSQRLLILDVRDDGDGRAPDSWAHGLGLGGVRKRVKALGGRVEWSEAEPCGIRCTVAVAGIGRGDG